MAKSTKSSTKESVTHETGASAGARGTAASSGTRLSGSGASSDTRSASNNPSSAANASSASTKSSNEGAQSPHGEKGSSAQKSSSPSETGTQPASNASTRGNQSPDAIELLKADHRTVDALFKKYKAAQSTQEKRDVVTAVCDDLTIHTAIEEEIFYPACRDKGVEHDDLDEAQVEHDGAKVMIRELSHRSPDDKFFDAEVEVLSEYIKHHVWEEEKPKDGLFDLAKKAGVDVVDVGRRLQARKSELKSEADAGRLPPTPFRALHLENSQSENRMSRQFDRNTQGRFGEGRGDYNDRDQYGSNWGEQGSGRGGRADDERGGRGSEEHYASDQRYPSSDYEDPDERFGSEGSNDDRNRSQALFGRDEDEDRYEGGPQDDGGGYGSRSQSRDYSSDDRDSDDRNDRASFRSGSYRSDREDSGDSNYGGSTYRDSARNNRAGGYGASRNSGESRRSGGYGSSGGSSGYSGLGGYSGPGDRGRPYSDDDSASRDQDEEGGYRGQQFNRGQQANRSQDNANRSQGPQRGEYRPQSSQRGGSRQGNSNYNQSNYGQGNYGQSMGGYGRSSGASQHDEDSRRGSQYGGQYGGTRNRSDQSSGGQGQSRQSHAGQAQGGQGRGWHGDPQGHSRASH